MHIKSLTSFRAIIAIVIFLFHCKIHLSFSSSIPFLDKFLINGATFMTGFLVLSGFILAHVYSKTNFNSRENILNFYVKRFARIYPAYIISSAAFLILYHNFSYINIFRSIVNDIFLLQSFFKTMFLVANNGSTWSVSVEMFLYFLFPFFMILSNRSPKILLFALTLAAISSFNVSIEKSDYIYANPIFRISDFLFGIGFYFLVFHFKKLAQFNSIHFLTIALIICISIFSGGSDFQYMQGNFLLAPLFALWISLIFYSNSILYNSKFMEFLGRISYSFYLWQFISIEFGKFLVSLNSGFNLNVIIFGIFVCNLAIATVSYIFIEEKLRKYISGRFS
jgi:peptidoglycan/LPS O-acetylase OafA/YrhL